MHARFVWGMIGALAEATPAAVIVDATPPTVPVAEGAADIAAALTERGTRTRLLDDLAGTLAWIMEHLTHGRDVTVVATGDRVFGGLQENEDDLLAAGELLSALRHRVRRELPQATLDNAALGAAMLFELSPRR